MGNNTFIESKETKITFPSKILKPLVYIAGIAEVISLLPYFNIDSIDFFDSIAPIGDIVATLIEVLLISLVAYKIYKEDLPISYKHIIAYAAVSFITISSPLFSGVFELTMVFLLLILSIVVGINFIKFEPTRNIGLFQIANIICIFLLVIFSEELFSVSDKGILKILILATAAPFVMYLGSCYDFLCENKEDNDA